MLLERLQRVAIERGHEDHHRHRAGLEAAQHLEAVDLGHLHVEEQDVGPLAADRVDRLGAVAALGDDGEISSPREQQPQRLPRQRLVVHDDASATGPRRRGRRVMTACRAA